MNKYKVTILGESKIFEGTKIDFMPSGKTVVYKESEIVVVIPVNALIELVK